MNKNKIYLIANWKMNPVSEKEAKKIAADIAGGLKEIKKRNNVQVVLCPPSIYYNSVKGQITRAVKIGAQNSHYENKGAFTGEISPKMLSDFKCDYVIVGHSERRQYFNESSELINKKIKAVLKNKMTPILAVGEKEGESPTVASRQLKEALKGISQSQVKKIIFAYEPIWAIGTGKAAKPDDAMSVRILLQKTLMELYSKNIAESAIIIYGGSTNSKNIKAFVTEASMQGALIGGSSLKPKEFLKMIKISSEL